MRTIAAVPVGTRRTLVLRSNGVVLLLEAEATVAYVRGDAIPLATSAAGCAGLADALVEMAAKIRKVGR